MSRRLRFRFRPLVGVIASMAVIASVVVLAAQADGRPGSEARSNDGGAWLVDREWGGVAHVEYLTQQPTVRTLVADPDSTLSVTQAPGLTAVHNRSSATVSLVDTANAALVSDTLIPAGAEAVARPRGLVVFDAEAGTVWNLPLRQLAGLESLEPVAPTVDIGSEGVLSVGTDGTVAITTDDGVMWIPEAAGVAGAGGDDTATGASTFEVEPVRWPSGFTPQHQTMVNGRLVATDGARWLTVGAEATAPVEPDTGITVGLLQQPNDTWPLVAGLDPLGAVWVVDLVDGTVADLGDDLVGPPNAAPVFHDRCVHALSGESGELQFTAVCLDGRNTVERGLDLSTDAELRLVNGFVWIDALDGSGYVVTPDLELEEIVDFSIVFQDEEQEETPDGDEIRQELAQGDPDAELIDADEPDRDEEPEPPIAVDDEAATRAGRPVYVDVLANDSDPNADVILIDGVELVSGDAAISFPASRNGLQISPQTDSGTVEVRYWITDGDPRPSHRVSAVVTVDVLPLTEVDNRPPEVGTDRLTGAVASVVTANLLDNDRDPDGDTVQLLSIDETAAPGLTVLSSHPGGSVILALPETLDGGGALSVPYTVADEWGAEAEGTIEIELRLADSNIDPDARNDAGVTQVGTRMSLNLLLNDTDADNDPLSILQPATPIGGDIAGYLATSEDGEFTFQPEAPGSYQFQYSVTDRQGSDTAVVRIEVIEPEANDPPVAVRDDAVLARGETRLVPVLENDGDPDGDVIGIVSQFSADNPNIKVVEQQGIGFWVTLQPGALPVETFFYRVSDGLEESELTQVVITRSDSVFQDAAPIVNDDQFRVRPGRTSRIDPLRNDYDPEGGPLTIVSATSTSPEAVVQPGEQGLALDVTVADPLAVDAFAITYVVADEAGNESAGEMEVALVPPGEENSAPVARSDRSITTESQPVIIPVLANDGDPESDPIDLEAATVAPASGGVELGQDGRSFVYTPAGGFRGTDQFTYLIRDAEGATAIGSVTVGVLAEPVENRDPVATPDLDYVFAAGSGPVVLDVIGNDFDPDGDPLAIIDVNGDAILDDGVVTFPIPDEASEEVTLGFTYEISDFRGGTDSAEVRITVAANIEPLPPVAAPDSAGPVQPGDTVTVDVLANDTDPDGQPDGLTVSSATGGAVVVGDQLQITAPEATADFGYTITDPDGLTDSSFVTVAVEQNLPPEVTSPIDLGEFFSDDTIPTVDLTAYASDPDGDPLVFANVSGQVGGTTLLDNDTSDARRVTFVPSGDHLGPAGFAFTVDDGNGHVVSGRVNLTLLGPSNTPPVGQDATITLEAGIGQPFSLASLFTDPDPGDTLTYRLVSGPEAPITANASGDTVALDAPITSDATTTSFVVEAADSEGEVATATVTVTLTATQVGPPQATPDTAQTNQEEAVTVDVLSNDIDTLGQGDLALVDATSGQGATSVSGTSITFIPADGFFGSAVVTYTIADGRQGPGGSAQGTLTVDVIGRPSPPAAVTANPLPPRSIGVSWQAPAANGSPITSYEVEVTVGGSTSVTNAGTSPSLTLTGLQPGEPYRFRVRATNAAGDGDWSALTAEVVVDQVPSPPGTPSVSYGAGQLDVTWPAAANEGSAIINYNLEISQCGSEKRNVGTALAYSWTGLANGSRCAFSVTAVNRAGESSASPRSPLECPATVPAAPGTPAAVRGDKQASVSWSQPANPDCESLLGYEVRRQPDGAVTSVPAGTVSWTSAPLSNGQSYSFEVRAQNRAGWGPWSGASASVIPCGSPLAPPAPTATRGDTQATVNRTGDADANGCAISQYQVSVNGGGWSALPASGVMTGLTNGTSYSFSIRAVNEIGPGDASAASNTVVPAGPPGAPTNVALAAQQPISWGWGAADFNGDPLLRYEYSHNGGAFNSTSAGATGALCKTGTTDSSPLCLVPSAPSAPYTTGCSQVGGTVTLQVRAVNSIGVGPTATGSATIPGCPSAPVATFQNPSQGGTNFGVSWTASAGATAYYLVGDDSTVTSLPLSPRLGSGNIGTSYRVAACNSLGCRISNQVP